MKAPRKRLFTFLVISVLLTWPANSADQPVGHPSEVSPEAKININIVGEVKRPGPLQLENGATVVDALAAAGGFGTWADLSKVRIFRKNPEKDEKIVINLRQMLDGKKTPMQLKEGDRVILPKILLSRPT